MKAVKPTELAVAAEPKFQYGEETFEARQKEIAKEMTKDRTAKNVPIKRGKSR